MLSKTGCALATACAALVPTRDILRSCEQSSNRVIQNFQLVWLDANFDELSNHNPRTTISILRHIINTANTFTDVNQCIEFLEQVKDEKVFLIVSGTHVQSVMPYVHDLSTVSSVHILCGNKLEHELWVYQWSKIRGVYVDMSLLCKALEEARKECDRNTISISFIPMNSDQQLDQAFVYTQVLKEILGEMKYTSEDTKEFLVYYQKQIAENITEQKNVEKFEREYYDDRALCWYTASCLFCSVLNRALRMMEIDTIIKMAFFIHDLHQEITQLHSIQSTYHRENTSTTVYRGQGMSQIDFDQLKKTQGGLLSFNNFLFASKSRHTPLTFARETIGTSDAIGVLFVMTIDSSIASTPFANIRDIACGRISEEVLFSIHPVFRIGSIEQISNNIDRLWQVELTLVSDDDPQLSSVIERIHEKTFSKRKGWSRLSELFIQQGQWSKAQEICNAILNHISDDQEKGLLYYQLGLIKFQQEEYLEADSFYQLSLEIRQRIHPPEHVDIGACYNAIGLVYEKLDEYTKALTSFEKASEIYAKHLPINDPLSLICQNNIARIYCQLGEYSKSISIYEKILEIHHNHSDIINTYNNIALVYEKIGEYEKAIASFEKTLAIQKKILSSNHLDLADSYNNIGSAYEKLAEHTIAVSYYEKSLEIYDEHLPADHPDRAALQSNIGLVYYQRHDYPTALVFLEQAHEIYRKILPANHSDLAASYVWQGVIYEEISKYSKALLYYKKAYEIYRNIHPLNHLDLASSYNNMGSVYFQIEEYPAALACYEKVLGIHQKHLPPHHPDLANSYSSLGDIYEKMADQSKALSFYRIALKLGQVDNHPYLQQWKDKIEALEEKRLLTVF